MDKVNTLEFKMIDPVEAGEEWAVDLGSLVKVVEIYIDGKEMLDIVKPEDDAFMRAEAQEIQEDEWNWSNGIPYGHVDPRSLYKNLVEATEEGSYSYDEGVFLFVCNSCGIEGCWSITMHVKEDDKYVYWYDFKHFNRDWHYNLSFKFDKIRYYQALEILKEMGKIQKRV